MLKTQFKTNVSLITIDAVHLNLKKLLRLLQIKNVDANSYYMYKLKVNFHISIQYSSSIDFHSILRVHC